MMCLYVDSQTSQPMQWRACMWTCRYLIFFRCRDAFSGCIWTVRSSINSSPSPQVFSYVANSCPEKTTTWEGGGLFIEHLTVHLQACHCMEIMAESATIIRHLSAYQLPLYYQPQQMPSMLWTTSVIWYTHHKLANTKILTRTSIFL